MNPAYYHQKHDYIPRRTHRKRSSVSKLSSDTVQTLPEYSSPPGWNRPPPLAEEESDRPPDYYPETADEADADTEGDPDVVYVPHHLAQPSPRRSPRRRKRASVSALAPASDPFLDTLLERSVHALEMSNALLQSSMSTQSSLSALLSSESDSDRFLEVRARNLSTRIRVNSGVHETWMDHLEEITKGVGELFGEEGRTLSPSADDGAISRSLPTSTMPDLRHRRRPSLLELNGSASASHLRYSHPTRDVLISPAPRALTQYVESTTDPQSITLPSTLGLRASASSHSVDVREHLSPCHQDAQLASTLSEDQSESTTPAYNLLSNLAKRSGSVTPPPSVRLFGSRVTRRASVSTISTERGAKTSLSPSSVRTSPERSRSRTKASTSRSRSATPKRSTTPPTSRRMTPPIEELSPAESTSSSDNPTGYRTVQSLRKILDEHPSSASVDTLQRKEAKSKRAPAFLPLTPPPVPTQGTSTATASISRLFTKGRHSMSTRPPSPPAHSSLKVRSVPPIPAPSPSTLHLPDVFGNGMARVMGSAPSSGVSTPKRISFAELPESYSGLPPGTSKLRERKSKKRSKQGMSNGKQEEDTSWLKTLLGGGVTSGTGGLGNREERLEERMARGWGSRPGYGTLDDWAV